jgi:hypothetical protein
VTREQFRAVALLAIGAAAVTFWVIFTATVQHFL